MRFVVVGGTSLVGPKVVRALAKRGHDVVAASTSLNDVTGASVVADVSNSVPPQDAAATADLLAAEAEAGVGHHVVLSAVGADRLALQSDYFYAMLTQEGLVGAGPIPYSIVRATPFFEFLAPLADFATEGNTVRLPPVLIQPMAAADVAEAIAIAAVSDPVNGIGEVGGPQVYRLPDLIRTSLTAHGDARDVVADPAARYWGAELGERTLVPGQAATLFETRFEDWILEKAAKP
jgi:uncharacterized protein YbjT (DUF2867 family)